MAVKIVQKKLTVKSLVEKILNVSATAAHPTESTLAKATKLHNAGAVLHVTMTRVGIQYNDGKLLAQQSLKMAAVTLCMQGKLGAAPTKVIRGKVIQLVSEAYQKFLDFNLVASVTFSDPKDPDVKKAVISAIYHGEGDPLSGGMLNKVAGIKKLRALAGLSLKEAKDLVETWMDQYKIGDGDEMGEIEMDDLKQYPGDIAAEAEMEATAFTEAHPAYAIDLGAKVIPLASATKLHESVAGTSVSSRYHVIALSEGIKVAVKIGLDHSVALRAAINGHPNSKVAQHARSLLLSAGLVKKPAGHYSLHLSPETLDMAKRCIGSTLFSINSFDQVSGQLQVLLDKGA